MNEALSKELKRYYEQIYAENPEETEEIRKANKAFEEELESHGFDFDTYDSIDSKSSFVAAQHRYKGFIDGYILCLTMMGMNQGGLQSCEE